MGNAKLLLDIAFCYAARIALRPVCALPIRKKRVLFVSYRGKQYSCNPRAVSEALERMAGGRVEIGWAFHNPEKFAGLKERGITVLGDRTWAFLKFALTARVVCTNTYYKPFLPRRRGQFYLRTWHGGGAYKRVGRFEKLPALRRRYVSMQQQGASLYLSSSRAFTEMTLRDAFGYRGEVMEKGMPRNDCLFSPNPQIAARVKAALGLDARARIALYAPTYREDARARDFALDAEKLRRALGARFSGRWAIVFRGHHVVSEDTSGRGFGDVDATDYPDMQELLIAADVLVTDYSSAIWDMSLTGKPAFLYCPDLGAYKAERDFFTDIRTWPYPLAEDNDALDRAIRSFDADACAKSIREHHAALRSCETGRASEYAARRILRECGIPAPE